MIIPPHPPLEKPACPCLPVGRGRQRGWGDWYNRENGHGKHFQFRDDITNIAKAGGPDFESFRIADPRLLSQTGISVNLCHGKRDAYTRMPNLEGLAGKCYYPLYFIDVCRFLARF